MNIPKGYHSELGKLSHIKSPRDPAHYKEMQRLSVQKRKANKLSTAKSIDVR